MIFLGSDAHLKPFKNRLKPIKKRLKIFRRGFIWLK